MLSVLQGITTFPHVLMEGKQSMSSFFFSFIFFLYWCPADSLTFSEENLLQCQPDCVHALMVFLLVFPCLLFSPSHMHHKFAIIDDALVMTGSYNWTKGARYQNREDLCLTNSAKAVRAFKDEFEKLWDLFEEFQL